MTSKRAPADPGHGPAASSYSSSTAARYAIVDGLELPLLPLERILASKRAAARPKDLAAIPAIEDALAVLASKG